MERVLGLSDWKFIGSGVHTAAYKSPSLPGKVIIRSRDGIKRLLAENYEYTKNSKHLPKIEYLHPVSDSSESHWYIMPEYEVGSPDEGTPAYNHYDLLTEHYNASWEDTDSVRAVSFFASESFTTLPDSLQKEIVWLAALVEDYARDTHHTFDFDLHSGNIGVDSEGNLILLDIFAV